MTLPRPLKAAMRRRPRLLPPLPVAVVAASQPRPPTLPPPP
jgi:hypothetical protein